MKLFRRVCIQKYETESYAQFYTNTKSANSLKVFSFWRLVIFVYNLRKLFWTTLELSISDRICTGHLRLFSPIVYILPSSLWLKKIVIAVVKCLEFNHYESVWKIWIISPLKWLLFLRLCNISKSDPKHFNFFACKFASSLFWPVYNLVVHTISTQMKLVLFLWHYRHSTQMLNLALFLWHSLFSSVDEQVKWRSVSVALWHELPFFMCVD